MKHPWGELRLKFDFTPEVGTKGSKTLGTFSEYCFAHEGSNHQHRLNKANRTCILKEALHGHEVEARQTKHVLQNLIIGDNGVKLFVRPRNRIGTSLVERKEK